MLLLLLIEYIKKREGERERDEDMYIYLSFFASLFYYKQQLLM
jgi:hypothetical protein